MFDKLEILVDNLGFGIEVPGLEGSHIFTNASYIFGDEDSVFLCSVGGSGVVD